MSCTTRSTSSEERDHRRQASKALAISALGLAIAGAAELFLALFTGSVALLGDALHNLSDVSTSAVVFLGFVVSRRPPSKAYPYGYERAEDLAGLGVALVIWLSAGFAAYESYHKLITQAPTTHWAWVCSAPASASSATRWSRAIRAPSEGASIP